MEINALSSVYNIKKIEKAPQSSFHLSECKKIELWVQELKEMPSIRMEEIEAERPCTLSALADKISKSL